MVNVKKSKVKETVMETETNKAEIKIWDSGCDNDDRYTILCGNKAFIFGNSALEDSRNIEVVSKNEIDIQWMDTNYKSSSLVSIPSEILRAIKKRL